MRGDVCAPTWHSSRGNGGVEVVRGSIGRRRSQLRLVFQLCSADGVVAQEDARRLIASTVRSCNTKTITGHEGRQHHVITKIAQNKTKNFETASKKGES